ncbi:sex determination protein fruitless isoform X1 [Odontomachus brunneus]|uniref:sex determination protein fruitless isoform X1 n=1 Tax=Odontomachus brunneus TaxID=486640 RepID=UPI0013F238CF|nr:sex determination protein fruitless isoform X1 [Odontomachus brunneus]XP_032686409.1 sex determination protein fruitless isoform X1 [Odontomachus brunneus]XP_032686410.1 sex determination protein fruitless isoform X1 [Odontomachus brunneus]XP_032686411.1 sex determination protein fruitless isoform X1 [Odontomachus brunneus]XP_032686412.1 sex determination protein fruitless isoform X1 [Odontomachus brunneus]XP_032686413.1 sex determination protein fruitless isoform X1 [Odontomachus brunneus]
MLQQRGCTVAATTPPVTTSSSSSSSNMFPQQYCLRWKYHHSNLQTMFSQLLERQAYCDVTLACEGKTLRAHKVVLSACSTYFDTILSQYEEKDPIVIMRDVKFSDIKVLVEFMYKGEINIDHTRLSSLLKTAEDLHIKGLAEVSWRSDSAQNDLNNTGHSPGAATPGVETVLREGDADEPPPPKQRRRGRPPLDDPPSAHDVFTPKITCITGNTRGGYYAYGLTTRDSNVSRRTFSQEEMMSEGGDHESWDDDVMMNENNETPLPVLSYMSKDDSTSDQEKKAPSTPSNSNATNPSIPEQFRDVIKMNDYLTTGRRQEFWEEPFTRRVMDAIKSKELEMKTAAEILGVSYGTLYGRYRDSYGCLKHPYRVRDFWSEPGPAEVLAKLRRKEITLFRAAEILNVTVHTLATYLATLQGSDRVFIASDGPAPGNIDGNNEPTENSESMNDILQKINATAATAATLTTTTPIKREGGGYIEVPTAVPKAATSVLENNPDITIVKTENMLRKREYTKVSNTENNNAKLMSGGAVSEVSQQQQQQQQQQKLADPLSLSNDNSKP